MVSTMYHNVAATQKADMIQAQIVIHAFHSCNDATSVCRQLAKATGLGNFYILFHWMTRQAKANLTMTSRLQCCSAWPRCYDCRCCHSRCCHQKHHVETHVRGDQVQAKCRLVRLCRGPAMYIHGIRNSSGHHGRTSLAMHTRLLCIAYSAGCSSGKVNHAQEQNEDLPDKWNSLTSERASSRRSLPLTELATEDTDTAELLYISTTSGFSSASYLCRCFAFLYSASGK